MTTTIPRKWFEDKPPPASVWVKDVVGFCLGMGGLVAFYFFLWIIFNPKECGDFLC